MKKQASEDKTVKTMKEVKQAKGNEPVEELHPGKKVSTDHRVSTGHYEEIKGMLLRQRESILAEAGVIIGNTLNPTSDPFPDWTDQASIETNQNFVLRLREREQQLLKKIDDALERVNEDTFGICEVCGGQISLKRLKARPVTTLCIECKTEQEMQEKMRQ